MITSVPFRPYLLAMPVARDRMESGMTAHSSTAADSAAEGHAGF